MVSIEKVLRFKIKKSHLNLKHSVLSTSEAADPVTDDVKYELYTKSNPVKCEIMSSSSTKQSGFNSSNPTRVFIHDYNGLGLSCFRTYKKLYFERNNFNIIIVDWHCGASFLDYVGARKRVSHIGAAVGHFIKRLNTTHGIAFKSVSVIGFGLGAHAAGIAGKTLNGQLGSIVGLSPSSALFTIALSIDRLNATDAIFVEIIHTSRSDIALRNYGDAEFFVAGVLNFMPQPGCGGIDSTDLCSASRSICYFFETIALPNRYVGTSCTTISNVCVKQRDASLQAMGGEPLNTAARGAYSVSVSPRSPYDVE